MVVKHPEFGVVNFTNPTARQIDILNKYKQLLENEELSKRKKRTTKRMDYFQDIEIPQTRP
jgi:hypothetical protein